MTTQAAVFALTNRLENEAGELSNMIDILEEKLGDEEGFATEARVDKLNNRIDTLHQALDTLNDTIAQLEDYE